MRTGVATLAGGLALFGFLRRRKQHVEPEPKQPDPRAEELRRKLAESRSMVSEREEFEAAETPVNDVQVLPPEDPEARRRAVHESARATAERMRERN
jgi:hypothetical protein